MNAVPTATLDRDDLAQVRAIARWQGRFSDYAVIDAVRKDTHFRSGEDVRVREVHLNGYDQSAPDQFGPLIDRLTVAQALGRLSKVERDVVESTVLGEMTLADWWRSRGIDDSTASVIRTRALRRLAATPEIAALRGSE